MMGVVIFLGVTTSLVWMVSPRVFRWFDRCIARTHLGQPDGAQHQQVSVPGPANTLSHAEICDALATAVRAGRHPHDALTTLVLDNQCPAFLHPIVTSGQHNDVPFETVLRTLHHTARGTANETLSLLLLLCCRGGTVSATALNTAASCLRAEETAVADIRVGTAHARITSRLLTTLPVMALMFGCAVSPTLRHTLQSPGMLAVLFVGLGLNLTGWLWIRSIAERVHQHAPTDSLQLFSFSLCVSLQAGHTLVSACESWEHISPIGESVATQLAHGVPLAIAVSEIAQHFGPRGLALCHTIVESAESGTPLASVASRLFSEEQQETKRRVETRLRQLPTALSLPIVFCVLPSFLLIALMPFVLVGLTSLPHTPLT